MSSIKELRVRLGMTQLELARKVGCSRATVAGWECGVSAPHIRYIQPLSKALRCKASDITSFYRHNVSSKSTNDQGEAV